MGRLLIIEDSESTRIAYQDALGSEHDLTFAATAAEGFSIGTTHEFDLLLIDLTLPDGDGFDLCRRLTQSLGSQLAPFLFVSGRYDLQDKLTGFAMGAEDYIVKPFEPKELQARVETRLRRRPSRDQLPDLAKDFGLIIDGQGMRVLLAEGACNRDLNLTPNEFRLLCALLSQAGCVLTRSELLHAGWGPGVHVLERTVDRHISALRRKLGPANAYLEAVPGSGYRWVKIPRQAS